MSPACWPDRLCRRRGRKSAAARRRRPRLSAIAKTAAEAARDLAQLWAEQAEDTPVTTGPSKYSAHHWANKANAAAALVLAAYLPSLTTASSPTLPTETRDYGTIP
jgi:hypothetical protein